MNISEKVAQPCILKESLLFKCLYFWYSASLFENISKWIWKEICAEGKMVEMVYTQMVTVCTVVECNWYFGEETGFSLCMRIWTYMYPQLPPLMKLSTTENITTREF